MERSFQRGRVKAGVESLPSVISGVSGVRQMVSHDIVVLSHEMGCSARVCAI